MHIASSGALLSQFWPGAPPRGSNFPLRNGVTTVSR
jgi:predicted Rossmann fold nucleotide-binding protein DprA/Smf involved in DNA uptake